MKGDLPRDSQGHGTPENGTRGTHTIPISLGIRCGIWRHYNTFGSLIVEAAHLWEFSKKFRLPPKHRTNGDRIVDRSEVFPRHIKAAIIFWGQGADSCGRKTSNEDSFAKQKTLTSRKTNEWQWKTQPFKKMYLLLKMVIFHCHVSFRGVSCFFWRQDLGGPLILGHIETVARFNIAMFRIRHHQVYANIIFKITPPSR